MNLEFHAKIKSCGEGQDKDFKSALNSSEHSLCLTLQGSWNNRVGWFDMEGKYNSTTKQTQVPLLCLYESQPHIK
jgi:hypothetical protein